MKIEAGDSLLFNKFNDNHSVLYDIDQRTLAGVNVKMTLPTKFNFLDIVFVSNFYNTIDDIQNFTFNGGGVFAGVSPKLKGKYFGITSEFAVGIFSYKHNLRVVNYSTNLVFIEKANSYGFGGMSSLDFYAKYKRVGINPSVMAIFTGGQNASFTFVGFNIPLFLEF